MSPKQLWRVIMTKFLGIEYSRGATAVVRDGGPANAPRHVRAMFPSSEWTIITPDSATAEECMADRFGDCFKVQEKIYNSTPNARHIMIGGDHSVNFGHFTAIADKTDDDLCLIYIDAHLDMHTPQSSQTEASGAPHGTNVRAALGDGDARWMGLSKKCPALRPENLFYLGTRSYEPSEIKFVEDNNIFVRRPSELMTEEQVSSAIAAIRERIAGRPFVVSFDLDAIDPEYFKDVWVPEPGGISVDAARRLTQEFADAVSFEFVEYAPSGNETCAAIVRELIEIVANKHQGQ